MKTESAKEMFEELGYKQTLNNNEWISYYDKYSEELIKFNKLDYTTDIDGKIEITISIAKAIDKQWKELRWLDEN